VLPPACAAFPPEAPFVPWVAPALVAWAFAPCAEFAPVAPFAPFAVLVPWAFAPPAVFVP
jgi:hypothetical protein